MTTTTPPMVQAPVKQPPARSFKRRMSNPIGSAIAIVIAILWTLPTFGLFISSFRPEADVKTSGWWTFFANPSFTLENYDTILFGRSSTWSLLDYIVNSVVITIPATIIPLSIAIMAAYAFSVLEWRGRDWVFVGVFADRKSVGWGSRVPVGGTGARRIEVRSWRWRGC